VPPLEVENVISKTSASGEFFRRVILPEFNNKMALYYCPLGVQKYFYVQLELIFNQSQKISFCKWQMKTPANQY